MLPIKKLQIASFVSLPKDSALKMVVLIGRNSSNLIQENRIYMIREKKMDVEVFFFFLWIGNFRFGI